MTATRDDELSIGEAAPAHDELARPAAEFLARVPWEGAPPDPDRVDAATFLEWL